MADNDSTSQDIKAKRQDTPEMLRGTLEFVDALSQEGFSQIASLARLAVIAIETKKDIDRNGDLINLLEAISGKAEDIQNLITTEAGNHGCSYISNRLKLRLTSLNRG